MLELTIEQDTFQMYEYGTEWLIFNLLSCHFRYEELVSSCLPYFILAGFGLCFDPFRSISFHIKELDKYTGAISSSILCITMASLSPHHLSTPPSFLSQSIPSCIAPHSFNHSFGSLHLNNFHPLHPLHLFPLVYLPQHPLVWSYQIVPRTSVIPSSPHTHLNPSPPPVHPSISHRDSPHHPLVTIR
ncbi:hypothetical protein EYC84_009820 [Monilinia fructicola]|uniref:Uncharacterized protein n=1 Tax=Monilinia fructicola TaxID=38448 RepID=A0A5M9JBQ0_MONFR|nr:hypothetical protein EYC84_009820 [Monilinia fructicola]